MIDFTFHNSVRYGIDALGTVADKIREFGFKRIGIVVDGNLMEGSDVVASFVAAVQVDFSCITHVYDLNFEPTYRYLDDTSVKFKSDGECLIDGMLAIGGGSAMDTAKAIAVMCTNDGKAISFRGFPTGLNKAIPVIAIPSTIGTGSELVFNASIIDDNAKVKMGINDRTNYPIWAVLDPRIVSTAPIKVVASSACDTLVHALESFTSKQSNPITRIFSKEAIRRTFSALPAVLSGEKDLDVWGELQWASYLAMIGLSNTTSGPSGALSYYLGTNYSVPHGYAGAVFIGKISRFNHERRYYNYSQLFDCIPGADETGLTDAEKSEQVVLTIEKILDQADVPTTLGEYGVDMSGLAGFIEFSKKAKAAFDFNPVHMSDENIYALLSKMMK